MPAAVFHAKTGDISDFTASKKCSPVYFVPAAMLQVHLILESREVEKWVKLLQKKYLMLIW
jgi:hypothetical protein